MRKIQGHTRDFRTLHIPTSNFPRIVYKLQLSCPLLHNYDRRRGSIFEREVPPIITIADSAVCIVTLDPKMNDADVSKQIQQMVRFIRQEAEEKANEISVSAEEEFNIEKLQLVEAEKKKIRQEYERKEKQVEVRRKM